MKVRNRLIASIIFVALFLLTSMANASPGASFIYQESNTGGLWRYDYTFHNTSNAGENLYKVYFDLGIPTTYTGLSTPTGWFVWQGQYVNTYVNAMSTNTSYDVAAGSNPVSGFSFTVDHQIGNISYWAEFRNSSGYSAASGTTSAFVAPVVPEPISWVLFLIGGILFIFRNRWKRSRQPVLL